jgi:hypothetical protein
MPLVPEAEQTVEVWMLISENSVKKGDKTAIELRLFANAEVPKNDGKYVY